MKQIPEKYKLIFLSILIALLLWFYVNNQNNDFSIFISNMKTDTEKTFFLDLEIKNLADDYQIENLSTDKVIIRLEEMFLLSSYKKGDFSAYIDLSGIKEGENIRLIEINSPEDVKIKEIEPEYVHIEASKKSR